MLTFLSATETIIYILTQLWPVWAAMFLVMVPSWIFRTKLNLYGYLYDTYIGIFGLVLIFFWVFIAIFADFVAPNDPLAQDFLFKRAGVGAYNLETGRVYVLGGDNLGRDLFSRVIFGSKIVLIISPLATLIAFMVGATLGLPAGYYGKRTDSILSFLANLILSFPVILLFYLLVTPGIRETIIPDVFAAIFFFFPILFFMLMFYSRYSKDLIRFLSFSSAVILFGGWLYLGLVFDADPLGLISLDPNELNIFVSVIFVSSPAIFRIVRGIVLDIKSRDYVVAAQIRGEMGWYIMLWEILPNTRGPLIVDFCLRIGYTTILLGTLGFFGLGLAPESPDWGSMINQTRNFIRITPTMVLPPTIALASLVLGLNLLADALREQSLKD